jgi:hypothetical protein
MRFFPLILLANNAMDMGGGGGPTRMVGGPSVREPGAVENRLSLDPTDGRWPDLAGWTDGQKYTGAITLEQISPGEFLVTKFVSNDGDGGDTEGAGEDTSDNEDLAAAKPKENPALANL